MAISCVCCDLKKEKHLSAPLFLFTVIDMRKKTKLKCIIRCNLNMCWYTYMKSATPVETFFLHFLGHYTTFVIIVLLSSLYFFCITLDDVTLQIQVNCNNNIIC